MGTNSIRYFLWAFLLILLQALIYIQINLWTHGIIIISAFIISTYPTHWGRNAVLFMGFFVGVLFDTIYMSGGLHTIASLSVGYFAPFLRQYVFDVDALDFQEKWCFVGFNQIRNTIYFGGLSFFYLIIYFSLLFFSLKHIFLISLSSFLSAFLTTLFIFPIYNFLRKRLIRR